jgi:hypothetical protein
MRVLDDSLVLVIYKSQARKRRAFGKPTGLINHEPLPGFCGFESPRFRSFWLYHGAKEDRRR